MVTETAGRLSASKHQLLAPGFTVMQGITMRHRFTGAIALTAFILTIAVMAALKPAHRNAAADYGADYLILNPEKD